MPRWGQLQDGMVHWVFEAETPPICHPSVRFVNLDAAPTVMEGFKADLTQETMAFEDMRPAAPVIRQPMKPGVVADLFRTVPRLTSEAIGYFGNVWIRAHHFAKAGEVHDGHTHTFDHVSFLTKGRVQVIVGKHATEYEAPNFIVIGKDVEHQIIALEDETQWWCVFAVRDKNGEVVEIVNEAQHDPGYFAG